MMTRSRINAGIIRFALLLTTLTAAGNDGLCQEQPTVYLEELKAELVKKWPDNRTLNLVFHGHSVPTGYFQTPYVHTLDAYPHLLLQQLKSVYPYAVINTITTSIGGENSEQGERRFKREVLTHRPDVLFIDYALNDRNIGLERSEKAMRKMIEAALRKEIKVILLTPSPDLTVDVRKKDTMLEKLAAMLRRLAGEYGVGLVDSYRMFGELAAGGEDLNRYMAQNNHPNKAGHMLIAAAISAYFKQADRPIGK